MRKSCNHIRYAICTTHVLPQNGILIPETINYSKRSMTGNQTGLLTGREGLLYLPTMTACCFRRHYWRTYALPNGSIVRSLAVKGDRIYIGGQQEIGYFFFDAKGALFINL